MQNDERTNGLPLSEKQGVGSSILPLATKVLATNYQNYTHFYTQPSYKRL